jgi:ABC-type molybdate transport system substrate-binding protein
MWLPFKVLLFLLVVAVVVAGFLVSRKPTTVGPLTAKLQNIFNTATSSQATSSQPQQQESSQQESQVLTLASLNITLENYPKIGGSSSTQSLRTMLACRAFNFFCFWAQDRLGQKRYYSADPRLSVGYNTIEQAYQDLINNKTDIILVDNIVSSTEQELVKNSAVVLNKKPIAVAVDAVMRSNTSQQDTAYKLTEWLLSAEGQALVSESGLMILGK